MNTQLTNDIQPLPLQNAPPVNIGGEISYPEQFEDEMGETAIHYKIASLFFNLLAAFFASNKETLIGANLNIYYEEGNPHSWFAPDIFVCFGVGNHLRRTFKTWEENKFPQVIFEIASDRTVENDLGKKYIEYARLGVEEYYLLDPERVLLPSPLMAFHREEGRLKAVPVENDRVLSPLLGLEIVDTGKSFRIFDPQKKEFLQAVLTGEE